MSKGKDLAFPRRYQDCSGVIHNANGLTKREYIATATLEAILGGRQRAIECYDSDELAREAVKFADALLAELAKSEDKS